MAVIIKERSNRRAVLALSVLAGVLAYTTFQWGGVVRNGRYQYLLVLGLLAMLLSLGRWLCEAGHAKSVGRLHSLADFNLYIPANAMLLAWIAGMAVAVESRESTMSAREGLGHPNVLTVETPEVVAPTLNRRLHEFARKQRTTLCIVLMAAYDLLINRHIGPRQFTVGVPVAG